MEEPKTVKMGDGDLSSQPTAQAGVPPFARAPSPPIDRSSGPLPQMGDARPEAATMLMSQRQEPVFAWLVVMDGQDRGRIHSLRPGATTVGRVRENDVVVADDACSSQHLKIRIERDEEGDDQFLLIDMASRNGTFAGEKSSYRQNRVHRHVLQDGDYLLLGETTLVFKRV